MENPAYEKLKELRTRKDLTIRPTPHLRDTYIALDGVEKPFSLRYYQIQGMLHLLTMPRFVLGDDCGIGKTPTTIVALCFLWEKNPSMKAIILTNKSAVEQWASEFMKFTKGGEFLVVHNCPAQAHECLYHLYAHLDGTGAVEYVRGHDCAVFGEGVGQVFPVLATAFV